MISTSEADRLIGRHVNCLPIESLPLVQCAGAVLREHVYAERDQPPFDRVAMDGIAVDSAAIRGGTRRLYVQALQAAGDAPLTLANGQHCIEIMTGAMLPTGCDAVDYLAKACLIRPLTEAKRKELTDYLGDLPPPGEWTKQRAQLNEKLRGLMVLMLSTPEYQLM